MSRKMFTLLLAGAIGLSSAVDAQTQLVRIPWISKNIFPEHYGSQFQCFVIFQPLARGSNATEEQWKNTTLYVAPPAIVNTSQSDWMRSVRGRLEKMGVAADGSEFIYGRDDGMGYQYSCRDAAGQPWYSKNAVLEITNDRFLRVGTYPIRPITDLIPDYKGIDGKLVVPAAPSIRPGVLIVRDPKEPARVAPSPTSTPKAVAKPTPKYTPIPRRTGKPKPSCGAKGLPHCRGKAD